MQVWLGYVWVFNLRIRMWHKVVSVIKLNNPFFVCLNNKNNFFEKRQKKMHNLKLKNSRQSMTNFLFGFFFQYNCRISTTPDERQTISQLAPVPPDTDGRTATATTPNNPRQSQNFMSTYWYWYNIKIIEFWNANKGCVNLCWLRLTRAFSPP